MREAVVVGTAISLFALAISAASMPLVVGLSTKVLCRRCHGEGRFRKRRRKRGRSQQAHSQQEHSQQHSTASSGTYHWQSCRECDGVGLSVLEEYQQRQQQLVERPTSNKIPTLHVIGGGLGGWALAVAAARHRHILTVLYERDAHLGDRNQGYALTLQQAAACLAALGIDEEQLHETVVSNRHVVHTNEGRVVGMWGARRWRSDGPDDDTTATDSANKKKKKKTNIHIARETLRRVLFQAATSTSTTGNWDDTSKCSFLTVRWNHRLISMRDKGIAGPVELDFVVGPSHSSGTETTTTVMADWVVGADGIRSVVRQQLMPNSDLRFLDCFVILGIGEASAVDGGGHDLLDGRTVFQSADGVTRWYTMPYSPTAFMWQLSFPVSRSQGEVLRKLGPKGWLQEANRRVATWHDPIPALLDATNPALVTGYPVFDRPILDEADATSNGATWRSSRSMRRVTLLGDAAHPMSPFKGQGANQALLDALSLARIIHQQARRRLPPTTRQSPYSNKIHNHTGTCDHTRGCNDHDFVAFCSAVWEAYEAEMMARTRSKVEASAASVKFLHSPTVLTEGDVTRGGAAAANRPPH